MSPQNLKGETVRPPLFAGFGKDVGDGWRTDDTCMCWYARHPSESRVFPCRFLRTAWCYSISGSRVYCVLYPGFIFCVNKLRLKQNLTNWLLYAQVCRNACHNFHLLSSFSRPTLFPDKPLLVYRSTNSFSTKLPSHSWAGRHFQCPQASISNEK